MKPWPFLSLTRTIRDILRWNVSRHSICSSKHKKKLEKIRTFVKLPCQPDDKSHLSTDPNVSLFFFSPLEMLLSIRKLFHFLSATARIKSRRHGMKPSRSVVTNNNVFFRREKRFLLSKINSSNPTDVNGLLKAAIYIEWIKRINEMMMMLIMVILFVIIGKFWQDSEVM